MPPPVHHDPAHTTFCAVDDMPAEIKSSSPSTDGSLEKGPFQVADVNRGVESRVHLSLYNPHIDTSGINERKLLRKLDLWLIPWLSLLYLLSFVDRVSIGNARVCTTNRSASSTVPDR